MNLGFLNPWLWLGALMIGVPLWLHLRHKNETERIEFSTLRFLEDQPAPRRGPLRLWERLLFALRALALLLIVAAFAWPYLRQLDSFPVRENTVYILDNTLSHQANDGFAQDRDQIVQASRRAPPSLQIAVIELRSSPR